MDEQDSERLRNISGPIGPATDNIHDFKKEVVKENVVEPVDEIVQETDNIADASVQIESSDTKDEEEFKQIEEESEQINNPIEVASETNIPEKNKKSFFRSFISKIVFGLALIAFLYLSFFIFPSIFQKVAVSISLFSSSLFSSNSDSEMAEPKSKLEGRISELNKQLASYIPDNGYIIVNSIDNEFTLMKGNNVVRRGRCSTGSMVQLEDDKRGKKFVFQTPKGLRKVLKKKKDPVWTKPDWAYIDDGLPIPSATDPSRVEEGVLGDYALELGNGYMIHGTIWQRYLGLPVTHGCIRLNDDDLRAVFNTLDKGSNVYIY
jgi:L,D-transpeptidase ErfK/SrfK